MIDSAKYKYLIIELIAILIATPHLSAQGLQFFGNKVPIEQRTSYTIFSKKQTPVFSNFIDIEFELRISQSETFGYLFHMLNPISDEAYSLTYTYVSEKNSVFKFNTEGKVNHISVTVPNDSVISQWLPVKLRIDLLKGESLLMIAGKREYGANSVAPSNQTSPVLIFGRREHLVDLPAFAIRNLKVSGERQNYSFDLNESQGHEVHSSDGKILGWVENPYWLIGDSYHWRKDISFIVSQCVGSKFNCKEQEIQFISPDSLFTYQTAKKRMLRRPYASRMPVKMLLGTNFINESANQMYAYEINNLPVDSITISSLDLSTLQWEPIGRAYSKVQLHHHNGFWDNKNHRYIVFGGFGNRLYSNKFLVYNEGVDRWDTLQFKGDNITPRFFSSMTSSAQGNYLYIYGGGGNESGDQSILDEMVPYDNDASKAKTMMDHLEKSFYHVFENVGPHGLPLAMRADWNDCINLSCFSSEPGESFQTSTSPKYGEDKYSKIAESVMVAALFTYAGPEYVAMCRLKGDDAAADKAQAAVDKMKDNIMKYGWDGEWFLRAYDDFGKKMGSHECEEGKIFIEPQGFAVMGGCGKETGADLKALESVDKWLNSEHGLSLNQPAFTKYYIEYGEISTYPAGYKENAGIFCHNNAWIICAEAFVGHGDKAFEYYSKIAPAYREEKYSDLHRTEPYVYAQMIAGKDAKRHGEAKNSWLTGTAAWNFVAVSQYILGIIPDWNGLKVDPSIPHEWDGFTVSRQFRGNTYEITVKNPKHICKGVQSVTVDGKQIEGNVLPVFDGGVHTVEVVMG